MSAVNCRRQPIAVFQESLVILPREQASPECRLGQTAARSLPSASPRLRSSSTQQTATMASATLIQTPQVQARASSAARPSRQAPLVCVLRWLGLRHADLSTDAEALVQRIQMHVHDRNDVFITKDHQHAS